jgi:hypothetical protein
MNTMAKLWKVWSSQTYFQPKNEYPCVLLLQAVTSWILRLS